MKKIAVIGGGTAGLEAALKAADIGMDVTVFEKKRYDDITNSGDVFCDIMGIYEKPTVGLKSRIDRLNFTNKQKVYSLDCRKVNLWLIDRKEWLENKLNQALEKGAIIEEGHEVSIEELKDIRDGFDYIIDASGVPSLTSTLYNFENIYMKEAFIRAEYVCDGKLDINDNTLRIKPFHGGYEWIYPHINGRTTLGIGVFKYKNTASIEVLTERLNSIALEEGLIGDIIYKSIGISPTIVPGRLVYDNIIMIGDAAGLSSPLYGTGLDLASFSAGIAVNLIRTDSVEGYKRMLIKKIAAKYLFEKKIREMWFSESDFFPLLIKLMAVGVRKIEKFPLIIKNPTLLWENREMFQEIWNLFYKNGKLSFE